MVVVRKSCASIDPKVLVRPTLHPIVNAQKPRMGPNPRKPISRSKKFVEVESASQLVTFC